MGENRLIEHLQWVSLLLELAAESPFKVRAYREAATILKGHATALNAQTEEKTLLVIKGIGTSVARTIVEFLRHGNSTVAETYQAKFPPGVLEILTSVRGLGVKKLQSIMAQFPIARLEDLLELCDNGQLAKFKGFGSNSVEKLRQNLVFAQENRGYLLYPQALMLAESFCTEFKRMFPQAQIELVGELRRKLERIASIELLTDMPQASLVELLGEPRFSKLQLHTSSKANWGKNQFLLTGSQEFLANLPQSMAAKILQSQTEFSSEKEVFECLGLDYVVPEFRELHAVEYLKERSGTLIENADIKGIIHSHTVFSDGKHSVEAMAKEAQAAGFEYIVISDHSQSSTVANGMKIPSICRQHQEIDSLNQRMSPFRIFKSVECDILPDGSLDYPDEVLASFDLVIIAVHQQLDLPKAQATNRILRAISHPYSSILAHPTARLLNTRAGYDLDFSAVFQACAEHQVAIEINTSDMRLDLDWRRIPQALSAGCLCSINPDAHSSQGIFGVYRGVDIARKAGLRAQENLSSYSLAQLENWITLQHAKRTRA